MGSKPGGGTPATVALTRAGVAFTVHAYEHDPAVASYGLEAARALGVEPARVFKTLVADVDGRLTVAVVPVSGQLDLKALTRGRPSAPAGTCSAASRRSASDARCRRSSTRRPPATRRCTCRPAGVGWTWSWTRPTWSG